MGLYIGQVCDFVQLNSGGYAIRTLQYRYALTPENHTDAQIRWEFVRFPGEEATYCRNHLQGPIFLDLFTSDGKRVTLNEMHLPTGWVPVEEVLRFCIVDLGVQPLHPDWDAILRRSERETWPSFGTMTDY